MAYYMENVNMAPERYGRAVVDMGQKSDPVGMSYYAPAPQMKRVGDDSPDTVVVGEATASASDLCVAPTASEVPVPVQPGPNSAAAAAGAVGQVSPQSTGAAATAAAAAAAAAAVAAGGGVGVTQQPAAPKQKLTVGATQLTMEQKTSFARLAIAWKAQGRPMREFDALMKAAGYQVSPSSLSQWMKLPDATCVLPPPRKRKDRDSAKRRYVRTWVPKGS